MPDCFVCSEAIKPEIERLRITPPQQILAEGRLHRDEFVPLFIMVKPCVLTWTDVWARNAEIQT